VIKKKNSLKIKHTSNKKKAWRKIARRTDIKKHGGEIRS